MLGVCVHVWKLNQSVYRIRIQLDSGFFCCRWVFLFACVIVIVVVIVSIAVYRQLRIPYVRRKSLTINSPQCFDKEFAMSAIEENGKINSGRGALFWCIQYVPFERSSKYRHRTDNNILIEFGVLVPNSWHFPNTIVSEKQTTNVSLVIILVQFAWMPCFLNSISTYRVVENNKLTKIIESTYIHTFM